MSVEKISKDNLCTARMHTNLTSLRDRLHLGRTADNSNDYITRYRDTCFKQIKRKLRAGQTLPTTKTKCSS